MRTASYMPGLPRRMGVALAALFVRDGYRKHWDKLDLIARIQSDTESIPLTADHDALSCAAEQAARECYAACESIQTVDAIVAAIHEICDRRGVNYPLGETMKEIIARAVDRLWWQRQIRKEFARNAEHVAIQLGFTSLRAGAYISHEGAARQAKRNADNAKLLEQIELENEHGQNYTLAALAALGTANKSIRRGELMARIRGFEEIAKDVGHLGVFSTITCPSKFHSVGGTNPKYDGSTPRDAQAHLNGVWAAIRASLHRKGIRAYGFRIAEPHTDGCPHWHMLMFIESAHLETYENTIKRYALAEDGDETGAQKNRVKIVRIEAGQGTAAGYIAKYVGKNIDGECVGDHKDKHGNVLVNDMFGNQEFTPSQRVTYWSQTWGIRQFQQIGGAPIGVWRELRRIKAETVQNAPEAIKAAWHAVQKIDNADLSAAKQADFAAYTRAQGGVFVGRRACIKIAKRMTMVEGRYATREEGKPCGVYHVKNENAVYESVRYTWTKKEGGDVAVAVPWTGVNNCTTTGQNAPWTRVKTSPSEKNFSRDSFVASENDQWSKKWEKIDVETYQNHRKNKTNSHLAELQRKHKDE